MVPMEFGPPSWHALLPEAEHVLVQKVCPATSGALKSTAASIVRRAILPPWRLWRERESPEGAASAAEFDGEHTRCAHIRATESLRHFYARKRACARTDVW